LRALCAFSILVYCSLARFDLVNRGVRQPYTYARRLLFDKTLARPHFAVVNCSDAMMNVFYSPFSNMQPKFGSYELLCRSIEFIFLRYPNMER